MSTGRTATDVPLPGGNFRLFITRLGYQGLISLGMLENPLTGEATANEDNARMLLDDLLMLQAKTEGNLDPDEREHLDKLVGDLEAAWNERIGASSEAEDRA
ncbi:MAG: DUF1844 domain-containing protein [Planctomycetota bacterium]|nr:DUF1844 domain-containing protein [Planctomycetota bacterium]